MNVQKTVKMKKHARKAIRVPRNKIGPEGKRKKGWKITEDPHFCPVFDGRPEFVYHPARMLSRNIVGVCRCMSAYGHGQKGMTGKCFIMPTV
jgi:hypothetical protein